MRIKEWLKIDQGWYEGPNGEIIQYWYKALGSPLNRAGWYLWPYSGSEKMYGPYKSMKIAMKVNKIVKRFGK